MYPWPEDGGQAKGFVPGQGKFSQAGCRPAGKFNTKRGKRPAWTAPGGCEYGFLKAPKGASLHVPAVCSGVKDGGETMEKNYKIKRYNHIYRGKRPLRARLLRWAATIAVVAAFAFIGWNAYGPIRDYFAGTLLATDD